MTRASPGRRQRRRQRRRFETRGRRTGSYKSLFDDPQRFSIAVWSAYESSFGSHRAARLAIVWIEEKTPITIEDVDSLLRRVSAYYEPPAGEKEPSDLDSRASTLAVKARLMTSRATPRELAWLTQSVGGVLALVSFVVNGNFAGVNQAEKLLRQAGWGEIIDRIKGRLTQDLRASFPPYEGSLTLKVRQMLAAMRASKI